jgi:hypothetical protein
MRVPFLSAALAASLLALPVPSAHAYWCYLLLDSKNAVIYRATLPPVDMSQRGKAARETLRDRGDLLLIMLTDECTPEGSALGPSGADESAVTAFVDRAKPVMTSSAAANAASGTASGGIAAPMPAASGPAPAAPGGRGGLPVPVPPATY